MGTIVPIKGTHMEKDSPLEALFGKTRRMVLTLLFGHSDEAFHLRKILRLAGISPGVGQRELKKLSDAGIILRMVKENQVLFKANPNCAVFEDMKNIIVKTAGIGDIIRTALEPLAGRISVALLFGSLARGTARLDSDVDLLVIGDESFENIVGALHQSQDRLRREINPVVMAPEEFRNRISKGDRFLESILKTPIIPILGDSHELDRLAGKRLVARTQA